MTEVAGEVYKVTMSQSFIHQVLDSHAVAGDEGVRKTWEKWSQSLFNQVFFVSHNDVEGT